MTDPQRVADLGHQRERAHAELAAAEAAWLEAAEAYEAVQAAS